MRNVRKYFIAGLVIGLGLLGGAGIAYAAAFLVAQGGTSQSTFTQGVLYSPGGTNPFQTVATTTASCSGSTTCTSFTVFGSSPITISSSGGGGGTGNVSTSTHETAGGIAYWTSNSGTPALLGEVATSSSATANDIVAYNSSGGLTAAGIFVDGISTNSLTNGAAMDYLNPNLRFSLPSTESYSWYNQGRGTNLLMSLNGSNGQLRLGQYGGGTITGTPAYNLEETSSGNIIEAAVPVTFGWPFPNNATTTGLLLLASTTIGAGGQGTGLTINGGATTTGNAYFNGKVGIGIDPTDLLDIYGDYPNFKVTNYDTAQYSGAGFYLQNSAVNTGQSGYTFYSGINDAGHTQGFLSIDETNKSGGSTGHVLVAEGTSTLESYPPLLINSNNPELFADPFDSHLDYEEVAGGGNGEQSLMSIFAPVTNPQESTMTLVRATSTSYANAEFTDITDENYGASGALSGGIDHAFSINIAKKGIGTFRPLLVRFWNQDLGTVASTSYTGLELVPNTNGTSAVPTSADLLIGTTTDKKALTVEAAQSGGITSFMRDVTSPVIGAFYGISDFALNEATTSLANFTGPALTFSAYLNGAPTGKPLATINSFYDQSDSGGGFEINPSYNGVGVNGILIDSLNNVAIATTSDNGNTLSVQNSTSTNNIFSLYSYAGAKKFSIADSGTTTATNGINITAGCFAVNGTCISGGGGTSASSTLLSDNNTFSGATTTFTKNVAISSGTNQTAVPELSFGTGTNNANYAIQISSRGGIGYDAINGDNLDLFGGVGHGIAMFVNQSALPTTGIPSFFLQGANGNTQGFIGVGTTSPTGELTVQAASSTLATASAFDVWGLMNTAEWLFERIDEWGNLIVSGPPPTLTSCSGGSVNSASNQRAGAITMGTGLTTCGVLFAHPYPSGSTVHVFLNEDSGTILGFDAQSISTTGFTIAAASIASGDVVSYTVIATQ